MDIDKYFDGFKKFLGTSKGLEWEKERIERKKLFSEKLSKDVIKDISEDDFREVIKSLWATGLWTNKDYKVDRLLEDNEDIEMIANSLFDVLYSDEPLTHRYDIFVRKIKGIGPSMLTEILAFVEPQIYCIWNDNLKKVLPFLEMDNLLQPRVFKYQITGNEYVQCINVLSEFKDQLNKILDNADFIDVDFFFAYIFYEIIPNIGPKVKPPVKPRGPVVIPKIPLILDHSSAQKSLIELGNLLDYDTFIPPEDRKRNVGGIDLENIATLRDLPIFGNVDIMDTVKHIDVLWLKDEYPKFGFEVEESTDVTKGLLRLYQLRNLHIKPIIIGPETKKRKFDVEMKRIHSTRLKININLYLIRN